MSRFTWVAVGVAVIAPVAKGALVDVPMNQQINIGLTYNSQSPDGDAIYPAFNSDTQTFFPGSHVRHNMTTVPAGWWYQYLDLNLAGITTPGNGLNLSSPSAAIRFDARYYQDFETNTNPYGDAPVFLRLYTSAADGDTYLGYRDYGIVYATQAPWSNPPYPDWTTVTVGINTTAYTDGGTFDVTNVSRIRWYGTDWFGGGDDFVDFKNVIIASLTSALPGDFNGDGSVDAADYVVWRKNPGGVYTPNHYATWRTNFGRTSGGSILRARRAGDSTPEPDTLWLLALGSGLFALQRRALWHVSTWKLAIQKRFVAL